jgi:hypothetical protein
MNLPGLFMLNRLIICRNLKTIFIFLYIIMTNLLVKAQDEVPDLITDRPDQTESSAVVPHKSLQLETGFIMENNENDLIRQKSFAYNTTLLRYGLLDNFELRFGLEYLGEEIKIKNTETTSTISGLSPAYAGFKVKIAEEDGWKPEMAFLGALILPFTAHDGFKSEYTAADIYFAFAHTLSDRFSLGYNLGAGWDGNTPIPSYFYSVSLGAGITEKLGIFIESYGHMHGDGEAEHLMDSGLTFLLFPNFQLDLSGGIGLQNSIDSFISFGLTLRLPT